MRDHVRSYHVLFGGAVIAIVASGIAKDVHLLHLSKALGMASILLWIAGIMRVAD